MNAIDFLVTHHRALEKEFEALKKAAPVEPAQFSDTANALAAHITVEEELFYPAVKAKRTEDILLESLEEHLSLKRVLADLLGLETLDTKFGPKMHVLVEQAEHHHEEEEEHLFPKVRTLLDSAVLEELGAKMKSRMDALIKRSVADRIPSQTDDSVTLK